MWFTRLIDRFLLWRAERRELAHWRWCRRNMVILRVRR